MATGQTEMEDQLATDLEARKAEAIARAAERRLALEAAQRRAEHLDRPGGEFGHGVALGIANTVGAPVDAVNAILSAGGFSTTTPVGGGDNIMDLLTELGVSPDDLPDEPRGVAGRAGEALAAGAVITPLMLAPFMNAAGDPNFDARQSAELGKFQGAPRSRAARVAFLLKQMGESIAKTAVENPKAFAAAELAGSAAAGAALGAAEEAGLGPTGQIAAGVAGGTAGALTVQGIPRSLTSMYRWGMRNLLPMTEAGGMQRAGRQTQGRAGDVERATARLDEGVPEGVTPARATGDERLLAQEARLLADDPTLDLKVREDLERAIRRTQSELADLYEQPKGKQDWEFGIFSRVAPPEAELSPGTTEDMLDQVYQSFGPLYEQAKGFPIRLHLMDRGRATTLETMFDNVPNTRTVLAGSDSRDSVHRWLMGKLEGIDIRTKELEGSPTVTSDDLLQLRSDIRAETRKNARLGASNTTAAERAELLQVAEGRVNQLLKEQLPEGAQTVLRDTDSMYRNYKVVENAVFGGGDQGLTPDSLLRSLRRSASSQGAYARGEQLEMRSAAQAGRPITTIMNNPERTRQTVQGMAAEDLADMQNQFVDELVRRSILPELADDGAEVVSGAKLTGLLNKYRRTAAALDMDQETVGRLDEIASALRTMEQSSPGAVGQLFEDGPANVLQLGATLIGAKQGQRIAGRGMGSSMVLASFFANKMRNALATLTADRATQLMQDAATDPVLYRALLTTPTDRVPDQNRAARVLGSWLAQPAQEVGGELSDDLRQLRLEAEELGALEAD